MNSQEVYLLSYLKYGENDAILHCFCKEVGFQSYFMKGIYSKKNKKKAYLLPLNKVALFSQDKKLGTMKLATRLELLYHKDLYSDIKANTVIFFVSDFLNTILRNENGNIEIYEAIETFIDELGLGNYQSHLIFLILLLKINGLAPLVDSSPYLDPETGTFSNQINNNYFTEEVSDAWRQVLQNENPYQTKIKSSIRKQTLESILLYYRYHFSDFKIPVSLEIIQQIFE